MESTSEAEITLNALSINLAHVVEQVSPSVIAVNARRHLSSSGVYWLDGIIVGAVPSYGVNHSSFHRESCRHASIAKGTHGLRISWPGHAPHTASGKLEKPAELIGRLRVNRREYGVEWPRRQGRCAVR